MYIIIQSFRVGSGNMVAREVTLFAGINKGDWDLSAVTSAGSYLAGSPIDNMKASLCLSGCDHTHTYICTHTVTMYVTSLHEVPSDTVIYYTQSITFPLITGGPFRGGRTFRRIKSVASVS